jgi:hypothetical protein
MRDGAVRGGDGDDAAAGEGPGWRLPQMQTPRATAEFVNKTRL